MNQRVNRAIDLLQAVAGRSQGAGVSEFARACNIKVQTAQTLLRTRAFRNLLAFDTRHRSYVWWVANPDHVGPQNVQARLHSGLRGFGMIIGEDRHAVPSHVPV